MTGETLDLFGAAAPPAEDQAERLREARDKGIRRAKEHAERVVEGWSEGALAMLRRYVAEVGQPFTTLALREWAAARGFDSVSGWAWGSVIVRAVKLGIIERAGAVNVGSATSHLKLSPLWRSVQ